MVISFTLSFSLVVCSFLTLLSLIFLIEYLFIMRGERDLLIPNCLLVPPFFAMVKSIFSPLSVLYYFMLLSVGMYLWFLLFTAAVLFLLILGILRLRVSLFGPVLREFLLLSWGWSILFLHVWISQSFFFHVHILVRGRRSMRFCVMGEGFLFIFSFGGIFFSSSF